MKLGLLNIILGVTILFTGCAKEEKRKEEKMEAVIDSHSYARPSQAKVTHLYWDVKVDFETKIISGIARWDIEKSEDAKEIHFDTRMITIGMILDQDQNALDYKISESEGYMGKNLSIQIKENTSSISIEYKTDPSAPALQWLNPKQTMGKENPFLFTQSQAILARSWIPCQDSPGIRFTYDARVEVPKGLMAVMSARNPMEAELEGIYEFSMPQAIPSYLMALAVGDFEFQSVGPRTGVYAEAKMLEKAAWEFADMEKMLIAAEDLYGPYAWERYDLIVLPPSFPFGGMENPRITFATPTVIAGDRSLTALVAHELAHSWSGNVVTNSNWNDFWLNEGFTVYFERRIMEALYGADYSEMLAMLGLNDLKNEISELGSENKDTHLHLNLVGRDPDEGMTDIAYEKGYYFLREIENTVGRERFDQFLRGYFKTFAFKPMTTEMFLDYLDSELGLPSKIKSPNPDEWVFGPGLPTMQYSPTSDRFENLGVIAKEFNSLGNIPSDIAGEWSTTEWLEFFHSIPDSLSLDQIKTLNDGFNLSETGNSEIFFAWMKKLIKSEYDPCLPFVEEFLMNVGRRKFILPLYEQLVDKSSYRSWAEEVYGRARENYHSVTYNSVDILFSEQGS